MSAPKHPLRILVAEDSFLLADTLSGWLADSGHVPVGPTSSVSEALARIEDDRIDAALLDLDLRGQASASVAQALDDRGIPFVLVTAYGQGAIRSLMPDRAPDTPILSKPFDLAALLQALERALSNPSPGRGVADAG